MDKDGTLKINWNEWRNYLILSPSANLQDILHYWRHASVGPAPSPGPASFSHGLSFFPVHICQYCLAQVRRVLHEVRVESICVTQAFPFQTVPSPRHVIWEWDSDPRHPPTLDGNLPSYETPLATHPHDVGIILFFSEGPHKKKQTRTHTHTHLAFVPFRDVHGSFMFHSPPFFFF